MGNTPYPFWDNLEKYCILQYLLSYVTEQELDDSDVYFLDVEYDKQIAEYNDYPNRVINGEVAVTDRQKLLKFLKIAEKANSYKCVLLDLRFEENTFTPDDSALIAQINSMRDVDCVVSSLFESNKMLSQSKTAYNDYFTTITKTNVTRYPFLQDGHESAALRIYKRVNHIEETPINKIGPFYYQNGSLCQNCPFLTYYCNFDRRYKQPDVDNYSMLGSEWFSRNDSINIVNAEDTIPLTVNNIKNVIADKIVIVGNYETDKHDTYYGMQSGPYIVYLGYKILQAGNNILSLTFIGMMFIIYLMISLFIINNKSIWSYIPFFNKLKNKFILFVLDMFGFSTILSLITILMYLVFHSAYNIFFPTTIFSLLKLVISYKNHDNYDVL
ncbi:MAG: hypothetical protein IJS19_08520 [Muribaculaceae bacterium]|nr:hypothetical protein [Muribaculaceae bacterium]